MMTCRPREFINELKGLVCGAGSAGGDRAALADLRHGIAGASATRAWPHIAPYCDLRDTDSLPAFLVVGAGFATHGGTDPYAGNLGNTLLHLAVDGKEGKGEEALRSFAGRFRRLLTCYSVADVCGHLPGILRAAVRKGIPINYELLLDDLLHWGQRSEDIKLRWAEAYWGGPSERSAEGGGD